MDQTKKLVKTQQMSKEKKLKDIQKAYTTISLTLSLIVVTTVNSYSKGVFLYLCQCC